MPVIPPHSLTARSIDAKLARKQQHYASAYSTTYIHRVSPPPALGAGVREVPSPPVPPLDRREPAAPLARRHGVPTSRSLFEVLREAEADLDLQGAGTGRPAPAKQPRLAYARFAIGGTAQQRLRKALLGGTAAVLLCGVAGGTYYVWANKGLVRGIVGGAIGSLIADNRAAPSPAQPSPGRSIGQADPPWARPAPPASSEQEGSAEILSLRPALQTAVPLPSLAAAPRSPEVRSGPSLESSEMAALPPTVVAPAISTETMPTPVKPSATAAPPPKPVEAPATPQALAVPAMAEIASTPAQPLETPAQAAKPSEMVVRPLMAAISTIKAEPVPIPASPDMMAASMAEPSELTEAPGEPATPTPTVLRSTPAPERTPAVAVTPTRPHEPAPALPVPAAGLVAAEVAPAPAQATATPVPADASPTLPPGVTIEQVASTMALVKQMALLVHDMHDENTRYRTDILTLTGSVRAKAGDIEQRLRLAEARSSVVAALETGRQQAAVPALPVGPADAGHDGSAAGPVAATPGGTHDYRVVMAGSGGAMLANANAPQDGDDRRMVRVGDQVPGAGRITAITQRGRAWVVQTDHGTIQ